MNRHVVAALFLVGCLLLTVPLFLMQHSGVANASITAGFMLPLDYKVHCLCLLVIGGVAAWLAREMLVLMPICALIMLLLGALSHIEIGSFPEVQGFTVGAILLFSLAMSMMRHRVSLACIVPIAAWAYFAGHGYMTVIPEGVQPLYFLLGLIESAALLIAIGVVLSMTIGGMVRASLGQMKSITALVSFLGFF
jgi:hydrogenase/urease accessory protein HupE